MQQLGRIPRKLSCIKNSQSQKITYMLYDFHLYILNDRILEMEMSALQELEIGLKSRERSMLLCHKGSL